jgi:hypothetical protein
LLKTITIHDFKNSTAFVYPKLSQIFEQSLTNRFVEQTNLNLVMNNGDIEIEGEITKYDVKNIAVNDDDNFAFQAKLSIEIKVKYINHKEPNCNVEQSFLVSRMCDVNCFYNVQDILVHEIVNELIDMIYNATVAKW